MRIFWEVDVVSAFSSSTSRMWVSAFANSTSQAERQNTKNQHTSLQLVCCSFFFLIEPLNEPYEQLYDEPLESQLTMRKYFPLSLNRRIPRPRYVGISTPATLLRIAICSMTSLEEPSWLVPIAESTKCIVGMRHFHNFYKLFIGKPWHRSNRWNQNHHQLLL